MLPNPIAATYQEQKMIEIREGKRKKILHVITGLGLGGAERMLYKLLHSMNANRFSQSVIVMMDEGVYGPKIVALGMPVYALNMRQGRPTIKSIHRLKKIVAALQPDLIQGWMYHGNLGAVAARSFTPGRPSVFWNVRQSLNEYRHEKKLTKLVIKLGAWLSSTPDKIIYNSAICAEQHEVHGYSKAKRVLIPNGFDTAVLRKLEKGRSRIRSKLGIQQDQLLIGTVARFHPIKDYANLIRAAEIVQRERRNVRYAFVGPGVDNTEPALRDPIDAARLSSSCHLLGERQDIADLMSAFDVCVLPSRGEAFPNVIGEAMSCELPCIVTDVGDSALIVDGCGIVVPADDSQALAAAILEMLEITQQERQRMGRAARQRIKDFYSMEKITAKYEREYAKTLFGCNSSTGDE